MKNGLLWIVILALGSMECLAQMDSSDASETQHGTIVVRKKLPIIAPVEEVSPLLMIVKVSYTKGRKQSVPLEGAHLSVSRTSINVRTNQLGLGALAFNSGLLASLKETDTLMLNVMYGEQIVATRPITAADMAAQYEVQLDKAFLTQGFLKGKKQAIRKRGVTRIPDEVSLLTKVKH